ncbi:MAG: recombinase family protein, partial [Ruminococcus sp.]|nr:recombinase family protein [Ruminococcus sp.]
MSERAVRIIPPTMNMVTHLPKTSTRKRRVAAYARVSTDSEEQLTSYEAQVDYYTNYIQKNPAWEYAGLYADEGISATNTKHRDAFNRMISDALSGKIDLIVTKSVSRFARNTVDSLTTVHKLKEKGIEVYFEKENIYTLDSKGELLITIMSSLAQEESRSISENVTWGQRKRFADGKVSLPYKHFLGYKRGENGLPEIVPEEAEIIRLIYRSFINGMTPYRIAKILTDKGIPTPGGKTKWQSSTIESILTNEKYKGSALLQKQFTVDFLTKKRKINEGEIPQYYIENSHEAIISPDEFELVQAKFLRRKSIGKQYNSKSIFAARIVCGDCGNFYGSKVWHSTNKYRRVIWRCNHK